MVPHVMDSFKPKTLGRLLPVLFTPSLSPSPTFSPSFRHQSFYLNLVGVRKVGIGPRLLFLNRTWIRFLFCILLSHSNLYTTRLPLVKSSRTISHNSPLSFLFNPFLKKSLICFVFSLLVLHVSPFPFIFEKRFFPNFPSVAVNHFKLFCVSSEMR